MKIFLFLILYISNIKSLTTCDSEGPGYFKMFSKIALELKPDEK